MDNFASAAFFKKKKFLLQVLQLYQDATFNLRTASLSRFEASHLVCFAAGHSHCMLCAASSGSNYSIIGIALVSTTLL